MDTHISNVCPEGRSRCYLKSASHCTVAILGHLGLRLPGSTLHCQAWLSCDQSELDLVGLCHMSFGCSCFEFGFRHVSITTFLTQFVLQQKHFQYSQESFCRVMTVRSIIVILSLFVYICVFWIVHANIASPASETAEEQTCMASTTVDRYLEAILNHLSCSTMSQLPGGGPPKRLQFHLTVIFACLCFEMWHHKFKITEGRGDAPNTSGTGFPFHSQKTTQVKKYI